MSLGRKSLNNLLLFNFLIQQLIDRLNAKTKSKLAGFDFNGIDQVTDDVIILLTELAASKTASILDSVTFLSFVGCVHLTDYAVKLIADAFVRLKEVSYTFFVIRAHVLYSICSPIISLLHFCKI